MTLATRCRSPSPAVEQPLSPGRRVLPRVVSAECTVSVMNAPNSVVFYHEIPSDHLGCRVAGMNLDAPQFRHRQVRVARLSSQQSPAVTTSRIDRVTQAILRSSCVLDVRKGVMTPCLLLCITYSSTYSSTAIAHPRIRFHAQCQVREFTSLYAQTAKKSLGCTLWQLKPHLYVFDVAVENQCRKQ